VVTNSAEAQYAALSHCWGKEPFGTTKRNNLAEHCKRIDFDKLTKTFQEAIIVTQSLGIRYLWIDSLCIVQDDEDDWRRESVKMGRVYKDAVITIAASGARDGSEGCFMERNSSQETIAIPYTAQGASTPIQGEFVYVALFPDQEICSIDQAPLGERAWITQEWMLSPRIVHFTQARMIWVCKTVIEAEDGEPAARSDEQWLLPRVRAYYDAKFTTKAQKTDSFEDARQFFADWCSLVATYTSRKLTRDSDKPIAIQGLATEISDLVGDRYTAGIFHRGESNSYQPLRCLAGNLLMY